MLAASEIAAVIGIILCVILNLLVIIVYGYKRRSIKVGEIQLVSLALSDFLQAGTGYALQLYAYNTPSEIGTWACKASGFCVTFLSLVSISHLVALSCERYITVIHPYKAYVWFYKKKTSLYFIIPAWLYGFLWAALPLVGWSSYSREQGAEHRCNINLYTYDDHHLSYTYTLLFFCFVVPLLSLIYCQVRVRMEIQRMLKRSQYLGVPTDYESRMEREQTFLVIVMIITFFVAWTPYAICVFWLTFEKSIPSSLLQFSAMFGKASAICNPVIYAVILKEFRVCLKKLFGLHREKFVASFVINKNADDCNILQSTSKSRGSSTTTASTGVLLSNGASGSIQLIDT